MTAYDADRLDTAMDVIARANRLAETHRLAWSLPLFGSVAAACHYKRGALDSAAAEAEAAVEVAERTSSRQTLMWSHAVLALVAVEMDDLVSARHWADAGAGCWASGQSSMGVDAIVLANARVTAAEGDTARALADLQTAWDVFEAVGTPICQPLVAYDFAALARRHGRTDLVDRVIAATGQAATVSGVASIAATGRWLVATRDSDRAGARDALERLRRTERRLDLARWLVDGAELLDDDPTVPLREALAFYDDIGAVGSAATTRARLAEHGQRDGGAVQGWDALTPTEQEIARLLGAGLTNAEIAQQRGSSRRTVESHLGRIYRKMGIEGRVKLTVAAADHFHRDAR